MLIYIQVGLLLFCLFVCLTGPTFKQTSVFKYDGWCQRSGPGSSSHGTYFWTPSILFFLHSFVCCLNTVSKEVLFSHLPALLACLSAVGVPHIKSPPSSLFLFDFITRSFSSCPTSSSPTTTLCLFVIHSQLCLMYCKSVGFTTVCPQNNNSSRKRWQVRFRQ